MLLGSNGQNIYPEELEAKIGMLPYVQESLVLMRDGKLEALIVPNMQLIEQDWHHTGRSMGSYPEPARCSQRASR